MNAMTYRVACVTGATSGFGLAIAEQLADMGVALVLTGRRVARLAEIESRLGQKTKVHAAALDVRDRAAVNEFFSTLPADFAALDVLVNNAGLALGIGKVPDIDPEEWEQMIDTNIKGLTYCTQAVLAGMVARDRGHIVNIGSVAGRHPYPGGNVYGGTKAFVSQFSDNLRADLLGKNIRVTNIEPGMAETEFSLVRFNGDTEKAASVYAGVQPLSAQDVAEAVIWSLVQPKHVNISHIELMPVMQANAGFAVHRDAKA